MVDLINGKGEGLPLDDWAIAVMGERMLLGRKRMEGPRLFLGPVYDFTAAVVRVRDGLEWQAACAPALGITSITELPIPGGTIIVNVSDLNPAERRVIARKVLACDELLRGLRLAASGVAVVQKRPVGS